MKMVLQELKVFNFPPIKLYYGNKFSISIAHNPVLHDMTNHVEVDKHFIKEKIERGQICITHVPTADQSADILKKGLPKKLFNNITSKLSKKDISKLA